jgi:hypothetical protein
MPANRSIHLTVGLPVTLTLAIGTISVARKEIRRANKYETDGVTHSVLTMKVVNRIMTDGVLLNRGRVSALRVLSASMVAWELTDTETIGDSRIGRIEI